MLSHSSSQHLAVIAGNNSTNLEDGFRCLQHILCRFLFVRLGDLDLLTSKWHCWLYLPWNLYTEFCFLCFWVPSRVTSRCGTSTWWL